MPGEAGRALLVLRGEEVGVVRLVPDRPQVDARADAPCDRGDPAAVLLGARPRDAVVALLRRPLRAGTGERELELHAARVGRRDQPVEQAPRVRRVGVRVAEVELRRLGRARLRGEVAPVDEGADARHAHALDLAQRLVAVGVRQQLVGRLEGHHLVRRGGRRRGRGEQRDEAEQEREQSWHRESEPARRRADAVLVLAGGEGDDAHQGYDDAPGLRARQPLVEDDPRQDHRHHGVERAEHADDAEQPAGRSRARRAGWPGGRARRSRRSPAASRRRAAAAGAAGRRRRAAPPRPPCGPRAAPRRRRRSPRRGRSRRRTSRSRPRRTARA